MSVTVILLRIYLIAIVGHLSLLFIEHLGVFCLLFSSFEQFAKLVLKIFLL